MKTKIAIIILFITLSGCSSKPYAIIDGSKSKKVDPYSYDVVITGLDGQMLFDGRKTKNVEAGPHYVQLTSVKSDRHGEKTYRPWSFNAEPCKRYVVAAKHDANKKFSNLYWDVELLRVETIVGCDPQSNSESEVETKAEAMVLEDIEAESAN